MNVRYGLLYLCMGFAAQPLASGPEPLPQAGSHTVRTSQHYLQQTVARAITEFEQRSREDWSYRISRYENEEGDISSSIELFEPTKELNKQWTLLSMNGQTPTSKQVRKFVRSKQKHADNGNRQSFSLKLRDIIQIETLQLLSEDPHRFQASFAVYLDQLGEEASQKLKGSLIFDKGQQYIETIEIINTGTFSPVFSADISEFRLTLRFIKIDTVVLPERQELAMKGTFAFFTEIDEVSTDRFSDYRYTGN